MSQFFFHIGMPKSASSYLQKNFFPLLDLEYLGKHYTSKIDSKGRHNSFENKFRDIFIRQPYNLDNRYKEELLNELGNTHEKILYSNEGIFGSYYESFRNNFQIIHNLKKVFDSPKLLIVIRRQDSFVESLYRQAIRNGTWKSPKRFLGLKNGCFGCYRIGEGEQLDLKTLNYNDFIFFCCELLGQENIVILPYELFKESKDLFLHKICQFLEVPYVPPLADTYVNRSDHYLCSTMQRWINIASPRKNSGNSFSSLKNLFRNFPGNKNLIPQNIRLDIYRYFAESNKSLSDQYHLNLNKFGYF